MNILTAVFIDIILAVYESSPSSRPIRTASFLVVKNGIFIPVFIIKKTYSQKIKMLLNSY